MTWEFCHNGSLEFINEDRGVWEETTYKHSNPRGINYWKVIFIGLSDEDEDYNLQSEIVREMGTLYILPYGQYIQLNLNTL